MAGEAGNEALAFHPMDQFEVKPLFDGALDYLAFSNATLWMGITVLCIIGLFVLGTGKRAVVPGRLQSVAELAYSFVYKMVEAPSSPSTRLVWVISPDRPAMEYRPRAQC